MIKHYPPELAKLIDGIIKQASLCLSNKALLQAIDFSRLESSKVQDLLGSLETDGKKVPPWLGKALLIAGHHLNQELLQRLALPYKLLNQLNDRSDNIDVLRHMAKDARYHNLENSELALSLVKGLKSRGLPDEALILALAHKEKFPNLMRLVSREQEHYLKALPEAKVRVLGFSTTNPLAQDLVPAFASEGFAIDIDEANFGEVMPELLKPAPKKYDAYILVLDMEGFSPHDWQLDRKENMERLISRLDMLGSALSSFIEKTGTKVFINTVPLACVPTLGFLDQHHSDGLAANINRINKRLSELALEHSQITLIDSLVALSDIAPSDWTDPKMWFYGRIPYSAQASRALASGFAKAWRSEKKGTAKVLALDLDNTMWGGIFGEDGVHGLQCGDDFPGNAFKAMQNEFLRLKNQGMILTILSKNNPDAITAFTDHSDMVLKQTDFVDHAINWKPKPQNIEKMAKDLNVGLDSFIFLDDSPHEREAMRRLCPEVYVPELPDDPAQRPGWLRSLSKTWPVRLTLEDGNRSALYEAKQQASTLKSTAASFEDYLAGLEQKLIIEDVSKATLPRIAQMHTKTNQFNLTTKRLDESDIKGMMEDGNHMVVLGRVFDKFGDHGIVICGIVRLDGSEAIIKTLLMSCRVIGREIETAFIGAVLDRLVSKGIEQVRACYIPTVKNVIVKNLYPDHGFGEPVTSGEETLYHWHSQDSKLPNSAYVETTWEALG